MNGSAYMSSVVDAHKQQQRDLWERLYVAALNGLLCGMAHSAEMAVKRASEIADKALAKWEERWPV